MSEFDYGNMFADWPSGLLDARGNDLAERIEAMMVTAVERGGAAASALKMDFHAAIDAIGAIDENDRLANAAKERADAGRKALTVIRGGISSIQPEGDRDEAYEQARDLLSDLSTYAAECSKGLHRPRGREGEPIKAALNRKLSDVRAGARAKWDMEKASKNLERLPRSERRELNRRIAAGEAARNELLEAFAPRGMSIARRFSLTSDHSLSPADLNQEAMLGVLAAIDRYDPKSPQTFVNYLEFRVKGACREAIARSRGAVSLDRESNDKFIAARRASSELIQEGYARGEEVVPAADEIAARAGLEAGEVADLLKVGRQTSLNSRVGEDGKSELGDMIAADEPDLADRVADAEPRGGLGAAIGAARESASLDSRRRRGDDGLDR